MVGDEGPIEKFQGAVVALICAYLLLSFFGVFPTEAVAGGPFSEAYWIISLIPWLLVILGVVLLLSMFSEVFE